VNFDLQKLRVIYTKGNTETFGRRKSDIPGIMYDILNQVKSAWAGGKKW
jgi:hypothetical protein